MRAWITWGFAFLLVGGSCVAAWGSEWGPGEVVPIDLPLLLDGVEDPLPTIVRGEVVLPGDCDYCYLHLVQYRFVVPAGAVRLVLELRNETNPTDDLDMILRLGQPITEDEDAYYFTYRTYEEGGSDRLEVGDEDDSDPLVPGEYYLGLVSLAGSGDRFEIRGACYVEEVLPEEVALQPNVPVRGTLPAQGLFPGIEAQFYLFVHEGAEVLAISAVAPGGEVDLHVGRRPVSRSASGRIEADLSLRASGEDEVLFLSSPALGRHWIVLENPTGLPQSFSLTATTVPVILPIESGGTLLGGSTQTRGFSPGLTTSWRRAQGPWASFSTGSTSLRERPGLPSPFAPWTGRVSVFAFARGSRSPFWTASSKPTSPQPSTKSTRSCSKGVFSGQAGPTSSPSRPFRVKCAATSFASR